jgi:hypothetical protein
MMDIEFTDRVMDFALQNDHVNVLFMQQAAAYRIPVEIDQFAKLVGDVAAGYKSKKPIKVTVRRSVEIVDIKL